MILPTEQQIARVLRDADVCDRLGNRLSDYKISLIYDEIIRAIKEAQFDGTGHVDDKTIRIAELEAKLAIYEAVVNGAGIKLAMPKARAKKEDNERSAQESS